MKYSVCVDALYSGKNFYDSIREIKKAGVNAIEFWAWWKDRDMIETKALCDSLDMRIAAFCTNTSSGLTTSVNREVFINSLKESIEVAKATNTSTLIVTVGPDTGAPRKEQHQNIVESLRVAVPLIGQSGITLVIEPLNTTVDHKGYYLWSSDEAFEIIDELGSPNIKVLFDIYHQQIMEGNIISRITANIDKIGHIHAAGVPGRHEIDTGEIKYSSVFKAIDKAGYKGFVGLEYFPIDEAKIGLDRLMKAGIINNIDNISD